MRKHTWKYSEICTSLVCGVGMGATVHCPSKHRQVTRVGNIPEEIPFLLLASQIIGKKENKCVVIQIHVDPRERKARTKFADSCCLLLMVRSRPAWLWTHIDDQNAQTLPHRSQEAGVTAVFRNRAVRQLAPPAPLAGVGLQRQRVAACPHPAPSGSILRISVLQFPFISLKLYACYLCTSHTSTLDSKVTDGSILSQTILSQHLCT